MQTEATKRNYGFLYFLVAIAMLVNLSGLFIPILGPDGTLYASISKTMALTNNYLELIVEGNHWLDKPHVPFWTTAISFELFGFHTWAYKLPANLFCFLGASYTYLFTKKIYDKQVALWSVIILLSAQHIIISNNDVRAEPYLTALVIGSLYHFYVAYKCKNGMHLLLGSLLAAFAVMTKGIFATIPIAGALAGEFILKKEWKELFNIKWLIAIILIILFIIPEIYCLYIQFDSHPERIVFGKTNISGIRFFLWDSQFGRFFNTGPIKGKGDPFFFVHTTLWAFLPWSLILFAAIYNCLLRFLKTPSLIPEWMTLSGGIVTFLVFSASRFQLPHYLNIVFPFFAIICAYYLQRTDLKNLKRLMVIQSGLCLFLLIGALVLFYLFRPHVNAATVIFLCFMVTVWIFGITSVRETRQKIVMHSALTAFFVNAFLNGTFYPDLLKYQSGSESALFANKYYPKQQVVQLATDYSYALEFYLNQRLKSINDLSRLDSIKRPFLLYVAKDSVSFANGGTIIKTFKHYPVSRLNLKFISKRTRGKELREYVMVLME